MWPSVPIRRQTISVPLAPPLRRPRRRSLLLLLAAAALVSCCLLLDTPSIHDVNQAFVPGARLLPRHAKGTADWGRPATEVEMQQDLPTLYVYDHCPYCVRARMIFGIKAMPHRLQFLLNDDVVTPTKLIGKKVLPILQQGDEAMGESLEIVRKIDAAGSDGQVALRPSANRQDIAEWQLSNQDLIRKLTRPRVAKAILPEFATRAARDTWARNHPLKDGTGFDACLEASPALLAELSLQLPNLAGMLDSDFSVNPGGLSYDDITLFPMLRTLTLVKGLDWPDRLQNYVNNLAEISDVPLFGSMAC